MVVKICYVTFPNIATQFSGKGLDRYAYELVKGSRDRLGEESVVSISPATTFANYVFREMEIVSRLRRIHAQVYHATSEQGLRSLLIARKKPIVVSIHDLIPRYFLRNSPLVYANQLLHLSNVRFADEVVVSSSFYGDLLTKHQGVSDEMVSPVHYGVDHSAFKPLNERHINNNVKLLFLGGLNELKGVRDVIEAFAFFSKSSNATLVIAGRGKDANGLKSLARERKVADRIVFTGYVDEGSLPGLYNSADLLVWPSSLGFGLPTLEAMSCGTPVIAADCFDSKEYMQGGALLYSGKDAESLSDRFGSVVTSNDGWKAWSLKALKWSQNFSWDKMMDEVFSVYRRVANV